MFVNCRMDIWSKIKHSIWWRSWGRHRISNLMKLSPSLNRHVNLLSLGRKGTGAVIGMLTIHCFLKSTFREWWWSGSVRCVVRVERKKFFFMLSSAESQRQYVAHCKWYPNLGPWCRGMCWALCMRRVGNNYIGMVKFKHRTRTRVSVIPSTSIDASWDYLTGKPEVLSKSCFNLVVSWWCLLIGGLRRRGSTATCT